MGDILQAIDNTVAGLCPCGAEPPPGRTYCGDDCTPTHCGPDTDAPFSGTPTAMRWRPELVSAADDTNLVPVSEFRRGPYNAQVFEREDGTLHLRLDDGHRYVGLDADPELLADETGLEPVWERLERELTDDRRTEPFHDPWPEMAGPGSMLFSAARGWPDGWVELGATLNEGQLRYTVESPGHAARFGRAVYFISPEALRVAFNIPPNAERAVRINREQIQQAFRGVADAARSAGAALSRVTERLRNVAPVTPTQTADDTHPMLRAIEARRRNANSGPALPQRPPRQVNPRRAR